ncbi:MAG: sigma-E processing peptidase SpoIIGA [Clostridia bacterium]|nr:sigma-E processing peptidase SpoIIGA [Clostridia bacterium]MDD4386350.1 sigma-E processing peptidase SpoIIGA [Clostridia bacterium]
MKIYLDYVFIENFIVNISILYQTSIFTKTKVNKIRLIVLSVFLSIISIMKTLEISTNIIIQILTINIVIYLLYLPKSVIKYIKQQMYYYLIYIMYIGIIISTSIFFSINLNNIYTRILLYIVTACVTYIINKYMWKIWINKIKYNNLTYKIVINSLNNLTFKVFVDTGNNIRDSFSNLDVIILNSKVYNLKLKSKLIDDKQREIVSLEVLTAIGKSEIKGYIFNDISIKKGGIEKIILKKAIILFIDEKINNYEYDGIISYNTYLEKLEGVTI